MSDNKAFSSYLDRRITIQKPTETRDPLTNERQTSWEDVHVKVPARKMDKPTNEKENLEMGSAIRSSVELEWQTRFFRTNRPMAEWRLIDEDGNFFQIISNPIELGRRERLSYTTMLVR